MPKARTVSRFNTQPPEGGWNHAVNINYSFDVSTHSRLKAAGSAVAPSDFGRCGFNTQPPEGGWLMTLIRELRK